MSESQSVDTPGRPRTAVPLRISQVFSACSFCKTRKIKCDGVTPACGGCTKFGRPSTCSLRTVPGRDYPTYLQNKIERLRRDLQRARADPPLRPTPAPRSPESSTLDFRAAAEPEHRQPSAIDALMADIGALPGLASSYPPPTEWPTLSTLVLSAASKSPLAGLATSEQTPPYAALPFLPKQGTALKLAQRYIDHVYPRLPFFSIQGFWTQFNHIYSSPLYSGPASFQSPISSGPGEASPRGLEAENANLDQGYSYFTVLLVLAISTSTLSSSADSMASNQSQRLFHAALAFRESAILPNSIVGVQSLLFLIQFATLNPSLLDAWYLIGVGMRNCVDLGLHQDPAPPDGISASLLETRRRLWWSMYSFDRSMSLGCGRPTEISDAVIGALLPTFRIESNATDVEVEGYLQRYRVLQLQSLIYDRLNSAARNDDPTVVIADLLSRLCAWRDANSPLHSQTLVGSEWLMSKMLLHRPCRMLPERTAEDLTELWSSALGFVALYRQLVEGKSILYVQIASEKVYWTGLAMLYSYWKLNKPGCPSGSIRPVDLWMGVRDVVFILQTLSELWEDGKILAKEFEGVSARVIELMESNADEPSLNQRMPAEVVDFSEYASLTSLRVSETKSQVNGPGFRGTGDELQDLISEMAGA
ncbi:Fungal specific transcription factor domain-containing protein [Pleurostoma richardsiae]|uniref:Fungal specific transcription factor domain-containing protein n=1 Tax=Pleurostoma richardsiae TaxID=41990 RepID=A0AA38RKK2_9PEZI|nr:Fungal specific transcription factor domain-containing protein [Pleurostoma richardsiae]